MSSASCFIQNNYGVCPVETQNFASPGQKSHQWRASLHLGSCTSFLVRLKILRFYFGWSAYNIAIFSCIRQWLRRNKSLLSYLPCAPVCQKIQSIKEKLFYSNFIISYIFIIFAPELRFRSSVGLEQQPSKLWVLGSNPSEITERLPKSGNTLTYGSFLH